jgi:hypothetical protein
MSAFACFASEPHRQNVAIFHDYRADIRVRFAIILSDALSTFINSDFAEFPIKNCLTQFRSAFREKNIGKKLIRYRHVFQLREMPTGDSRIEHCVLHRGLDGTSTEVVVNSVTTTEKVQELRIGNRSLRYLRIEPPLWQFSWMSMN